MLLSDHSLRREIELGNLILSPHDPTLIQPSSIDVRLDGMFRTIRRDDEYEWAEPYRCIDPLVEQPGLTREIRGYSGITIEPGAFLLGSTIEKVTLGNSLAARIEGKSSLGRLGLMIHSTAGFIDPGFTGQITLELSNVSPLPIRLTPGMLIGQLCVFRLTTPVDKPYGHPDLSSRYQGQEGPTESRFWQVDTD